MNNRERMKEYVLFAQGAGRKFFATEPIPFMDRTAKMLLDLIDRVPSEEEMMALRCGVDLIEYEITLYFNGDVSEDREQVFKSIRKALGIEGKEGEDE